MRSLFIYLFELIDIYNNNDYDANDYYNYYFEIELFSHTLFIN